MGDKSVEDYLKDIHKLREQLGEAGLKTHRSTPVDDGVRKEEHRAWKGDHGVAPSEGRDGGLQGQFDLLNVKYQQMVARVSVLESEIAHKNRELAAKHCELQDSRGPTRDTKECGPAAAAEAQKLGHAVRCLEEKLRNREARVGELEQLLQYLRKEKDAAIRQLEVDLQHRHEEVTSKADELTQLQKAQCLVDERNHEVVTRSSKAFDELNQSHRRLEAKLRQLNAERDELLANQSPFPVENVMDAIKVRVITLDKRCATTIANIGCWPDKEPVFRKAFTEIKRMLIDARGDTACSETKWNVTPDDTQDLSAHQRHCVLKNLIDLVISWDMMSSVQRYGMACCDEIVENSSVLSRLARDAKPRGGEPPKRRRADSIGAGGSHRDTPSSVAEPVALVGRSVSPAVTRRAKLLASSHTNKARRQDPPSLSHRLLHHSLQAPAPADHRIHRPRSSSPHFNRVASPRNGNPTSPIGGLRASSPPTTTNRVRRVANAERGGSRLKNSISPPAASTAHRRPAQAPPTQAPATVPDTRGTMEALHPWSGSVPTHECPPTHTSMELTHHPPSDDGSTGDHRGPSTEPSPPPNPPSPCDMSVEDAAPPTPEPPPPAPAQLSDGGSMSGRHHYVPPPRATAPSVGHSRPTVTSMEYSPAGDSHGSPTTGGAPSPARSPLNHNPEPRDAPPDPYVVDAHWRHATRTTLDVR